MQGKNYSVQIFALGKADSDCSQVLAANAKHNGWSIEWVDAIPSSLPAASLCVIFNEEDFPSIESLAHAHCFLALEAAALTRESLMLRSLALGPHFLDEAWSIYLQEEVHRLLPIGISEETRTLALLSAGLAQCLTQDVVLLHTAVAECLHPAPAEAWHPSMPLARLVYLTAALALENQSSSRESFRNALRQHSAALSFRLRSDLRLASEACFSKFWEDAHAA